MNCVTLFIQLSLLSALYGNQLPLEMTEKRKLGQDKGHGERVEKKLEKSGNGSVLDQQVVRRSMPSIKQIPYKDHPKIIHQNSLCALPTFFLKVGSVRSTPRGSIVANASLSKVGRTGPNLFDDLMRYESNFFGGYLSHLRFVALNLHCFFGPTIVLITTPKIWWKLM